MNSGSTSPIRDCSDVLEWRVVRVANNMLKGNDGMVALLAGLRADGREFLFLLGTCHPDDHVRRREFAAHVLAKEGVIAYAHAAYCSTAGDEASVQLHVVAESTSKGTLARYEIDGGGQETPRWKRLDTYDYVASDYWHPYARLPEACEIDDGARAAEYEAEWRTLRDDDTRCVWGWNVECQLPGFPFPTSFAGRPITSFLDYETTNAGLGYGAKYETVGDETLDLYAYSGGLPSHPMSDQDCERFLDDEFASAWAAIDEVRTRSPDGTADVVQTGTISFDLRGVRPMRIAQCRIGSDGGESDSFLIVAVFRNLFVKVRYSVPRCVDAFDRAREIAGWLAGYLSWLESPN